MKFSDSSLRKLNTVDEYLKAVFIEAIKDSPLDFGISCGYRSIEEQQGLYAQGRTTPGKIVTKIDGIKNKSKHNYNPSKAVDIIVYIDGKITWEEDKYRIVARHILDVAKNLGIKIRWGNDWNMNGIEVKDDPKESFVDIPHFEIV